MRGSSPNWTWIIGRWQSVVRYARDSGVVAEITGRSAEEVEADAELARQALLAYPRTSVAVQQRKDIEMLKFCAAPMSALMPMLDTFKWEESETLTRPPAWPSAIRDAEGRLGCPLPDGLEEFYLTTNGLDIMPAVEGPGLKPVEELRWESAEDLGLSELRVELGCKFRGEEWERLPRMGRVLKISDEDSEEQMWYVDAETIGEAMRVMEDLGRSDEIAKLGGPGWGCVISCISCPLSLKSLRGI